MQKAAFIGSLPARRCLALFVLLVSFSATHVSAQAGKVEPVPAPVPARSDVLAEPTGYRGLIAEAVAEYEARHFEEARALFRRAHEMFPNARTMRGQGMAEFELRNYRGAIQCFESALSSRVRPLGPALRTETVRLIARAGRFVSRVRLTLHPSTASVLVDGVPVPDEPEAVLLLSIGSHTVEIRADGYLSTQLPLTVEGGEEQVFAIELEPAAVGRPKAGSAGESARRFTFGPQLSGVAPLSGYAQKTPGMGIDLSLWSQFSLWVVDTRIGLRFDVAEENREYFHVPFELAGYRMLPFADHGLFFGVGTGITYIREHTHTSRTIGNFAITRIYADLDFEVPGVPLFARVGAILFRSSAASLVTSVDYSFTFVKLASGANEQALRAHLGVLFGRSRR